MLTVVLTVTILTVLFSVLLVKQQQQFIHAQTILKKESITNQFNSFLQYVSKAYQSRLQSFIKTKPEILAAFAARNRQQLFVLTNPFQVALQKENRHFSTIIFITPENTSFLRMAMPDLYDDDISDVNTLLVSANARQQAMAGFEMTKMGLQYLIVQPVYVNGNYSGLIGFSINAEFFLESIASSPDLNLAVSVSSKLMRQAVFSPEPSQKLPTGTLLMQDQNFPTLPPETDLRLTEQRISVDGHTYLLFNASVFHESLDAEECQIVFALEITPLLKQVKRRIILSILVAAFLLLLSLSVVHFNAGKLLRQIVSLNKSLADNNYQLMERVEDRTAELRKQVQVAYQAQKEWERTFDAVPSLVCILDTDRKIVLANKAMVSTLGKSLEQLVGLHCYQCVHCKEQAHDSCPYTLLLQDHKHHQAEFYNEHLQRYLAVTVDPIFNDDGSLFGAVHIAQDITEMKEEQHKRMAMEKQVQIAEKMEIIGTLSAGIAHDFNNILTAIIGYGELAEFAEPDKEELRQYVREMMKAGKRAQSLVAQILTFSCQHEVGLRQISIAPVVKEVLKMLATTLPAGIEIRQDLAQDCGFILADPARIHQLIMNLCTNAYHAMGEKGVLSVSLNTTLLADNAVENLPGGEYITLAISDTGCGIAKDIQDKMFSPFFTTKEDGMGTGMGLYNVRKIVRDYGGAVQCESAPGHTTFTVFLPIADKGIMSQGMDSRPLLRPDGKNKTVLLVDDDEAILAIGRIVFTSFSFSVITASNGEEALEHFNRDPDGVDLIITDQDMPRLSGIDMAREVLRLRPDFPVVLVTGFSSMVSETEIGEIGVHKLLRKPVSINQYAEVLLGLGFGPVEALEKTKP